MSSGCILGNCSICDEFVYEGEWSEIAMETDSIFIHDTCQGKYFEGKRMNGYIKHLENENKALKEELKMIRREQHAEGVQMSAFREDSW